MNIIIIIIIIVIIVIILVWAGSAVYLQERKNPL